MDRSVVARATSSDDSPTPAYLYGEIAQMTHANFEGCRQLTVYLLERIKKPNHNIKFKCLQIIKHVCLKGRSDFKIAVARESQVIKDCLTFSGPPDPLRGEEIYRKVREAAKETLDAVFSETPAPGVNSHTRYASGNRIEGFGSGAADGYNAGGSYGGGYGGGMYDRGVEESYGGRSNSTSGIGAVVGKAMGSLRGSSGRDVGLVGVGGGGGYGGGYGGGGGGGYTGGGGGSGRGSTMQGMGNYDPSKDKTWLERTSDSVRGSVGTSIDAVSRRFGRGGGSGGDSRYMSHNAGDDRFSASSYMSNRGPNSYDGPGYRPEAVSSSYETARANSQAYAANWNQGGSSSGPVSTGSGIRGGWANDNDNRGGGGVTPGQYETPNTAGSYGGGGYSTGGEGHGFVGRTGGGDADGGYEGKLVEEICAAGGTKSTPTKPELDAFLSKAASLDPGKVASALVSVLGAGDWRARNKGLAVVEALHRSNPSYRIPLEDAFQNAERGVIPLCSDSKPAVRDRAVRVSKLLGLEAPGQGQDEGSKDSESKTGTANNGYSRAPDGEPGQTTAAPSGPPVDLLGGIDSDEDGGKGGGVEGVPVPGEAVRDIVDLLDDDDGGGGGGGKSGTGGLDDFLGLSAGGDAESDTRTSVVANASSGRDDVAGSAESLFGGLSVKGFGGDAGGGRCSDGGGDDEGSSGPAPVLASGGGSGFAFIASAEEPLPVGDGDGDGSARGGGEKASPSGLDMLMMSPPQRDAEGGEEIRRKKPTTGDDLLSLDPVSSGGNKGVTSGTSNGKGVSTKSSGGSLLDWAAAGGSGSGGGGKVEGKKGSDADDGGSGAVDRNKMLQEKVMRMQQQQQKILHGGVFGAPGMSPNIPGVGLGTAVPMSMMYPSGVGLMRQPGATGSIKTIPDPLMAWGGGSSSGHGQRGGPHQRKGDVVEAAGEGGQKAPDSFSFVRDAMQDSIK